MYWTAQKPLFDVWQCVFSKASGQYMDQPSQSGLGDLSTGHGVDYFYMPNIEYVDL